MTYDLIRRKRQTKIYVLIVCLLTQSCGLIFTSIQGAKFDMKKLDSLEILNLAEKYKIPKEDEIFELKTNYFHYLYSDTISKIADSLHTVKNHTQLLDYSVYNEKGILCGYYFSCLGEVTPFLVNMDWNANGELNNFPPTNYRYFVFIEKYDTIRKNYSYSKTYLNYEPDSLLPLKKYLNFIMPLRYGQNKLKYDYTLIIQWNRFLGRQTMRFVDAVKKNMSKSPKQYNLRVIWCYNENAHLEYYK